MDGFFVTINCSKVFDSNETFYKIFIRKNEMSIVYELVEWIRFMFGLERCFFLIHENSVIHELEDISVLEILNSLEIRPCLRSHCIHKKMERNLFHKLNLFTYWDEMKVHKLFQARCNCIIENVSNSQNLNAKEKPDCFPLQSGSNFFEGTAKSGLANDKKEVVSPSKLTQKFEDEKSQVIETVNEDVPNNCQWDLKKANGSLSNNNETSNEINMPQEFSSQNSESLTPPETSNLNLIAEKCSEKSSGNKKQKLDFHSKKFEKIGIPFSVGTLVTSIREEARSQEFEKEQELNQSKKSFDSGCSVQENTENEILNEEELSVNHNKDLLKRKRKRRHKKRNLQVESAYSVNNMSWDHYEPSVHGEPNHIRFNDNDEEMETETTENAYNLGEGQENFNYSEASDNVNQQMVTSLLTTKSPSPVEKNELNENYPAEDEVCEKSVDSNSEKLNDGSQTESGRGKKKLDDFQQNVHIVESLKKKIKHRKICLRFY